MTPSFVASTPDRASISPIENLAHGYEVGAVARPADCRVLACGVSAGVRRDAPVADSHRSPANYASEKMKPSAIKSSSLAVVLAGAVATFGRLVEMGQVVPNESPVSQSGLLMCHGGAMDLTSY
jgi:hypothetical protein